LPLQQATVGLGYSADTGPRASLEHLHRRLLGRAIASTQKLEWGRDTQRWSGDLTTHPLAGFHRYLLGAQVERVRSDVDVVLSQRLRLGRTTDTPAAERLVFVEWLRSRQAQADGGVADARAASANLHLVLRRLDHMLLPTKGYSLSLQLGGGQARSSAWPHRTLRPHLRAPDGVLAVRDAVVRRCAARGRWHRAPEGGRGARRTGLSRRRRRLRARLPLSQPGTRGQRRHHQRPCAADRQRRAGPPAVGATAIGVGRGVCRCRPGGAALDRLLCRRGWGVGVRWRSPVGALRADLAWGQELRKARLHISAGVTF
jgi:translocation and assembly module TamA